MPHEELRCFLNEQVQYHEAAPCHTIGLARYIGALEMLYIIIIIIIIIEHIIRLTHLLTVLAMDDLDSGFIMLRKIVRLKERGAVYIAVSALAVLVMGVCTCRGQSMYLKRAKIHSNRKQHPCHSRTLR